MQELLSNSLMSNSSIFGSGGSVRSTIIKITPSLTPPANPSTGDVYIECDSIGKAYFQNADPAALVIDNDVWIKISLEYIEPKLFKKNNINITSRSVNRDYGSSGTKPAVDVKIMSNDLYDFYVALGMVLRRENGAWVYKRAYMWTGSAWQQISWTDFYVYSGNPITKLSPDGVFTAITGTIGDGRCRIVRKDRFDNVYLNVYQTSGNPNYRDLLCYDKNGNLKWKFTCPTPEAIVGNIAFDLDDNIWVTLGLPATQIVYRLSKDGVLLNTLTLSGYISAKDFCIDKNGDVLAVYGGSTTGGSIAKLRPDFNANTLTVIWQVSIKSAGTQNDVYGKFASDENGYCWAFYTYTVTPLRYRCFMDNDGNILIRDNPTTFFDTQPDSVQSSKTLLYAAGKPVSGNGTAIKGIRKTSPYDVVCSATITTYTYSVAPCIRIDQDGYVYVMYCTNIISEIHVAKYTSDLSTKIYDYVIDADSYLTQFDGTMGRYDDYYRLF